MKKLLLILFLASCISCTFFDTFDETPMFVEFEEVNFTTSPEQGINTHKVTGVEVFADGFSVGVFSLPAKVPVLQESDSVRLSVFAVIRNNGIGSNPVRYPFYTSEDFVLLFQSGASIPLELNFKYRDDAKIIQVCDFEVSNCISGDFDGNSEISFERSADTNFGNFSGQIEIPEVNTFFEKTSFTAIDKSTITGPNVFLEMDYKSDIGFGVGVVLSASGIPDFPVYKINLNSQEDWNKIYIELSTEITAEAVEDFRILFGITTATTDKGSIWLDNLRVLHF